jgi:hypothetical protein
MHARLDRGAVRLLTRTGLDWISQYPTIAQAVARYEISEEPQLVYTCHCTACRRVTSSAFSMGIVIPDRAFHITAAEQ